MLRFEPRESGSKPTFSLHPPQMNSFENSFYYESFQTCTKGERLLKKFFATFAPFVGPLFFLLM